MGLIADVLLAAGAIGAGLYCFVLSRRLTRFTDLEHGVGGAVAVLSAQVDDMTKALDRARSSAAVSAESLETARLGAEDVLHRLEMMLAATHDMPAEPPQATAEGAPAPGRRVVWRRPRGAADTEPQP